MNEKFSELIKEILKFSDNLQGRQTNFILSLAVVDNLCYRDWAQFHDPKNLAQGKLKKL
jgi:hypothetical protein